MAEWGPISYACRYVLSFLCKTATLVRYHLTPSSFNTIFFFSMGKEWFRPKAARKAGDGSKHVMGCMTGFFHWFDLHRVLFTTKCSSSSSGRYDDDDDGIPMSSSSSNAAVYATESGVKPPRNSLELDLDHLTATTTPTISSLLTFTSEDYDIPFCIQVRKAKSGGNIVAKLMGLEEYLPNDTNIINNYNLAQPCSSFSHTPRQQLRPRDWNVTADEEEEGIRRGTRSLPETPARMSIASRPSWDSDPRISVQEKSYYVGNKENLSVSAMKELKYRFADYSSSPASATKKMKVENGCSSSPRQYARDIVKQMKERVGRRMERSRATRNSLERPPTPVMKESQTQTRPAACSPRTVQVPGKKEGSSPKTKSVTKLTPLKEITECKKVRCDRFKGRLRSPPPPVAVSSSRKPRRSNRMNPRMPIIDVRREDIPVLLPPPPPPPPPQPPVTEPEELQYVKRVLERVVISRPRSNYPLDPIIFHELELSSTIANNSTSQLRHRCNRKLLFDIIKEIIVSEPLVNKVNAKFVLDRIWSKIRSYPQSKCQTMEDIDALVGSDLRDMNIRHLLNHHAVEEEGDIIAGEVENMVIDFLVVEVEHNLRTQ